jgi:hypothetical protein
MEKSLGPIFSVMQRVICMHYIITSRAKILELAFTTLDYCTFFLAEHTNNLIVRDNQ